MSQEKSASAQLGTQDTYVIKLLQNKLVLRELITP